MSRKEIEISHDGLGSHLNRGLERHVGRVVHCKERKTRTVHIKVNSRGSMEWEAAEWVKALLNGRRVQRCYFRVNKSLGEMSSPLCQASSGIRD